MANEGLVRDPGTQKFNSPSGDWHPGQGDDPNHHYFLRGAIFDHLCVKALVPGTQETFHH